MNIGIILYSQTGNTLSVAKQMMNVLEKKGHKVSIERVEIQGELKHPEPVKFSFVPDSSAYDALILASPVHGFSLSTPMRQYLEEHSKLRGKRIACFVTMAFPFAFMGGNRTIGQMRDICKGKGGKVIRTGVVNWMGEERRKGIMKIVVRNITMAFPRVDKGVKDNG